MLRCYAAPAILQPFGGLPLSLIVRNTFRLWCPGVLRYEYKDDQGNDVWEHVVQSTWKLQCNQCIKACVYVGQGTEQTEQKGCQSAAEKLGEREYRVLLTVGEPVEAEAEAPVCTPDARTDTVVAIASDKMGEGAEELGKTLLKAFVFSLTQQDKLPKTILFYNGGAHLTCAGSPMLDDLKALEAEGVEILTCGTCLNFYGLTEQLAVGGVTNMYVIAEKMLTAGNVVKP